MSDEAPPKKDEGSGAPAWVMTFADLMSLLMCFFVLLLSFAEMDLLKFKQIAGSMKMAFGVQRDIKVKEMPKGTSIIAQEFSPGKPTPTLVEDVRQQTVDETKQTLEFTDATTEKNDQGTGEQADNTERAPIQKQRVEDNDIELAIQEEMEKQLQELAEMATEMNASMAEMKEKLQENLSEEEKAELQKATAQTEKIDEKVQELLKLDKDLKPNPEVSEDPAIKKTKADAQKLMQALAPEIQKGLISIETEDNKILLRIKEKGSFPSGSSTMKGGFLPVINKLKSSLNTIEGEILVAGHTDNVPIKTRRFRSNWELSSSRAVTVVHELLDDSKLNPRRFAVEGHGSSQPLVPNSSAENRALNRRVELIIVQGANDTLMETSLDKNDTESDAPNAVEDTVSGVEQTSASDSSEPQTDGIIEEAMIDESEDTKSEDEDKQESNIAEIGALQDRLDSISEGFKEN